MEITVTEAIDTVGWKDGESQAPQDLVHRAKQLANLGAPTAFAKTKKGKWVVLSFNPEPCIVAKEPDEQPVA